MVLPVNIDSSYSDTGDATVKLHQQHHDIIHTGVNHLARQVIDARDFGVTCDGFTDDTAALQALITANLAVGVRILLPGSVAFTQLDLTGAMNMTLAGTGSWGVYGTYSVMASSYAGSGIIVNLGSSRGVTIEYLEIRAVAAGFTGVLVDASQVAGNIATAFLTLHRIILNAPAGALSLARTDGGYNIYYDTVQFLGSTYPVIGKKTQGVTNNGGWTNHVAITRCSFNLFAGTAIRNPDQGWDINAVFERNNSGAAAVSSHDPGVLGTAVTFRSCWMGDDVAGVAGTWIKWSGTGLTITGCEIESNDSTSVLALDEDGCRGISIHGNRLYTSTTALSIITVGATKKHASIVSIGNDVQSFSTPYNGLPTGSITDDGIGALTLSSPVVAGNMVVPSAQIGTATFGLNAPNLLTAQQADFETTGSSTWTPDTNCASVNTSTTQALHGTRSLAMVSTAAGTVAAYVPSIAATPGMMYSALASFRSNGVSRQFRVGIWFNIPSLLDVDGLVVTSTGSNWVQSTVSAVAPIGTTTVGIILRADIQNAGGAAETYYVDQCSVTQGPVGTWAIPGAAAAPQIVITNQSVTFPGGPKVLSGTGSPASVVSAPVGSTFLRSDGGTSTSLYVKETGAAGNTGWVAK
jgi:hypothetical protein